MPGEKQMIQVVLSDEQANAVRDALEGVELRDRCGELIGYVSPPLSRAVVEESRRRLHSNGPWYTTQEVLAHLNSLEKG
jgi:hypothetical protein